MAAPTRNNYWKKRKQHGPLPKYPTPAKLWEAACDYFQWCDDCPWYKTEYVGRQKKPVKVPLVRPYTQSGLCLRLGISPRSYRRYRRREGFESITCRIDDIIYVQKYEGAVVGAFNPSIIARDLALYQKRTRMI